MKRSVRFIFCHGWGFSPKFWQPLAAYLDPEICTFLDLGYDQNKNKVEDKVDIARSLPLWPDPEVQWIGIGHSLGLMKLLALPIPYQALIGVQSFTNFLGYDPGRARNRRRVLDVMCEKFTTQPHVVLNQFYQNCFETPTQRHEGIKLSQPHWPLLSQDLERFYGACAIPQDLPMLILATTADKIVSPELIYDNFTSDKNVRIDMIDHERVPGHTLGYHESEIVLEKIVDFIDELSQR